MTTANLTALIVRADRLWCRENAGEQRPRDWAQQLAAAIQAQVLNPLRARMAQLEAWCSCAKPPADRSEVADV